MKQRNILWAASIAGTLACAGPVVARTAVEAPVRQSFHIEVPNPPAPVRISGDRHLIYELHLTSFASTALALRQVRVLDGASGEMLATFEGQPLASMAGGPVRTTAEDGGTVIEPGMRAVIYVDLPIGDGAHPEALRHRVTFGDIASRENAFVESGAIEIDDRPLPVLGPPLKGGPWTAVYDPGMERGHRRVVYAVDGKARIPGRFAIDWFKVDDQGRDASANATRPSDYHGYGAEVLAVADGVVVATRGDMTESATLAGAPKVALADATGNYIALDLGHGRYAFYEHLKPGLLVEPGDRVRKGQVIAALGFTGQTTGPHLHFHVGDAKDPLATEGKPYLLDDFQPLGAYESIEAFGNGEPWSKLPPQDAPSPKGSFPMPNMVVHFPD
jgi:murein DD-endopeptidase